MKKLLILSLINVLVFANGIGVNNQNSNINPLNREQNINVILNKYMSIKKDVTEEKDYKKREKLLSELQDLGEKGDDDIIVDKVEENKKIAITKSNKFVSNSFILANLMKYANSYKGIKYVWGGTTRDGLDCSGFTLNVFRDLGIPIPRVSRDQYAASTKISSKDAKAGDLVFFKTTAKDVVSHVGIYLGNNKFIHASSKGKKVQVNELTGYYKQKFTGFGRYIH